MLGGGGGTYILRFGRCCLEIWEVLCWVGGGGGGKSFEIWEVLFRDMGGAVWGWEDKNFERWEVLFRDMRDAVSGYGRCCFEKWEVLNLLMRGGDINFISRIGGLVVSVPASGWSGLS